MSEQNIATEDTYREVGGRRVLVARAGQPIRSDRVGVVEAQAVAGPREGTPTKSAPRGEWDAYAASLGLNPDDYKTKEDVIAATENAGATGVTAAGGDLT